MALTPWTWIEMAVLGASLWLPGVTIAQGNFEIQVYGSETVEPGTTMFEVHSNLAIKGTTTKEDGIFPTQHAAHETIEITHGFTPWLHIAPCGRTLQPSPLDQGPARCALEAYVPRLITSPSS